MKNTKLGKYTILDKDTQGIKYQLYNKRADITASNLVVNSKHINHAYLIEFSSRLTGYDIDYNQGFDRNFITLQDPLTLAYI